MMRLQTVFKTPTQLRVACFILAFLLLAATTHVLLAEGLRYARWANGEAFHPASFADGERVILFAMAAGGFLLLLGHSAAEWLVDRVFPIAEEIPEPPPPEACPVEIGDVLALDPDAAGALLDQNSRMLPVAMCSRVLWVLGPSAQPAVNKLEQMVGLAAIYHPGKVYVVSLRRRGAGRA